jgi:hypothetical protein
MIFLFQTDTHEQAELGSSKYLCLNTFSSLEAQRAGSEKFSSFGCDLKEKIFFLSLSSSFCLCMTDQVDVATERVRERERELTLSPRRTHLRKQLRMNAHTGNGTVSENALNCNACWKMLDEEAAYLSVACTHIFCTYAECTRYGRRSIQSKRFPLTSACACLRILSTGKSCTDRHIWKEFACPAW